MVVMSFNVCFDVTLRTPQTPTRLLSCNAGTQPCRGIAWWAASFRRNLPHPWRRFTLSALEKGPARIARTELNIRVQICQIRAV